MVRFSLFVVLLALFLAVGNAVAQSDSIDINISMDGAQAGTASSAVGSELGTGTNGCFFDDVNNILYVKIQFSGLGSNVTAAHIHGPAAAGVSAGVIQSLTGFPTGVTSGSYTNSFTLNTTNEGYLKGDQLYINIHTVNFGGGEIRGQLINGGALPVELTSFTAIARGKGVELAWRTATEVNNHGFEIQRSEVRGQRSEVSGQWVKIGFVDGAGNSNATKEYSYTDKVPVSGKYLYRLKQVDNDGKFEYSSSVEVNASTLASGYELAQNHPNPFNPTTNIAFALAKDEFVSLKVYDMLGKEIATLVNGKQTAGAYSVPFDASSYPSGIYFYTLRAG
ncbi:MAG: CHRD domain-containing protein, partial [Ignavibacteriales bacterium]|nr:CHRD domain-containing protein [Ignavibacteriales bacterium]